MTLSRFLFSPASPRPLAALRIGVSLVLFGQGLVLWGELPDLYGQSGILQGALKEYLMAPLRGILPGLGFLHALPVPEPWLLQALFFVYLAALVLLLWIGTITA